MTKEPARRTAGVVLAYRPDATILDNLRELISQVDAVYVVCNSPAAEDPILRSASAMESVRLLDQGGNVGVAAGFNAGMRAAMGAGYDFTWIFDQDSMVVPGMLDALIEAHAAVGDDVGIVGPALRSHATGMVYQREQGQGAQEVDTLISSGSLFSRGVIERVGLHDEALFIDYVDHDISLRARAQGLRNFKVYSTLLDHRFGDSDPVSLFGRRVYAAHYSPDRQYYMARNRIIVVRRFGFGRWFWEDLGFTTKSWIKVMLLERNKVAKMAAAARGMLDGLRYRG